MERDGGRLTCPSRPKFRVGAGKKEVERNEEGWFRQWLAGTEAVVEEWVEGGEGDTEEGNEGEEGIGGREEDREEGVTWPRSPSWFETNLEVWRQL
jgi:hypothetical protein